MMEAAPTSAAARLYTRLFAWRTHFAFARLESLLLALYILVLALILPHHEPWADEAQAWVLARDNSIWQILRFRLHYEGAPALWHLILHTFQLLGGRYAAIDYLGALFATAGVAVFLRWSPFPLAVRALLPFTFFIAFQYGVIGRSYVLFPLLVFTLATLFHSRRNPAWFALVAGLLANLSFQGTTFSFCITVLFLWNRWRYRRSPAALPARQSLLPAAAVYFAFLTLAGLVAVPGPDCVLANGQQVTTGALHEALLRYPGELPGPRTPPPLPQTAQFILPPTAGSPRPHPTFLEAPGPWAAWFIFHDTPAPRTPAQDLLETTVDLLSLATWPISTSHTLALTFILVSALWLLRRRRLRLLIPWAVIMLVGEKLWIADHHAGMLFIAFLAALWIAAESPSRPPPRGPGNYERTDRTFVLLLTLVCLLQVSWLVVSARNDRRLPYDPGPETARFLLAHKEAHPEAKKIAAFGYFTVGVQPFYAANPFFNLPTAYWVWSSHADTVSNHFATLEQHPDLVVFSEDLTEPGFMRNEWAPLSPVSALSERADLDRNPIILDLRAHGYHQTQRFCGQRFTRLTSSYKLCHLIFEPTP